MRHSDEDAEFHRQHKEEFDEFVKEEHGQWKELNRTLGQIEGQLEQSKYRSKLPTHPDRG